MNYKKTDQTNQTNYKGFYKVRTNGGTFVTETFFNPTTREWFHECTRDYDYDDGRRDIDELYYLPLSKYAQNIFDHNLGIIKEGERVKIVNGRKMLGESKVVRFIYEIKVQPYMSVEYVRFTDGTSVALKNCAIDYSDSDYENKLMVETTWEQVKARKE